MSFPRGAAGLAVVTALAMACGSFTSSDPPVTPPGDGGPTSDAPQGDAPLPDDAGADRTKPPRFCGRVDAGSFCDDFDDDQRGSFEGKWDPLLIQGSAPAPRITSESSASAPNAARFETTLAANGVSRMLQRQIQKTDEVHVALEFNSSEFGSGSGGGFIVRVAVRPGIVVGVGLNPAGTDVRVSLYEEQISPGATLGVQQIGVVPSGQWHHVELDVAYGRQLGEEVIDVLTARVDQEAPLEVNAPYRGMPVAGVVQVGAQTAGSDWTLLLDNVVVSSR